MEKAIKEAVDNAIKKWKAGRIRQELPEEEAQVQLQTGQLVTN